MSIKTERENFEAWVKADSTLPVDRDPHGYVDMTTALMWHAWRAAQKANAPEGALVGEADAGAWLGLAAIDSACAHDFALDPGSSIMICKHCRRSQLAAKCKSLNHRAADPAEPPRTVAGDGAWKLPPLPEPHWPRGYHGSVPSGTFTGDQVHAYARAAVAQALKAQAAEPSAAPLTSDSNYPLDDDRLIRFSDALAAVPGGAWCDPQQVTDALRLLEPVKLGTGALTDELIVKVWNRVTRYDNPFADDGVSFVHALFAASHRAARSASFEHGQSGAL